jgi:hypothetical protein
LITEEKIKIIFYEYDKKTWNPSNI